MFNFQYMKLALAEANKAFALNEVPVGAVLVHRSTKTIVAQNFNQVELLSDQFAHAEMLILRSLGKQSHNLQQYDLYVTLEPCMMCKGALLHSNIGRIFWGAKNLEKLSSAEIYQGILESECQELLSRFFKNLR